MTRPRTLSGSPGEVSTAVLPVVPARPAPTDITPLAVVPGTGSGPRHRRLTRVRRPVRGPRADAPWPVVSLRILAGLLLGFVAAVAVVGPLQHGRDQTTAYADFRINLAEGTAPVGPVDFEGNLLPLGASVAVLEIPRIGVHEVVGEGTTSGVLRSGPGHLRSTVLPGQPGTSAIFGRRAGYGGPFGRVDELRAGDPITVQTGQGTATYTVTDVRRAGDPLPVPLAAGKGRLTLVTADGAAYVPQDLIRVDAELTTAPQSFVRPLPAAALSGAERPLQGDSSALVPVVLLGQALLLALALVTWARLRWGRLQAWTVGVPVLSLTGLATADAVARLLPNLL